ADAVRTTRVSREDESSLEPQRNRAVVHQLYFHHRAEFTGRHCHAAISKQSKKALVQRYRLLRPCRVDEAGAAALCRVAVEGELRYDEELPGALEDGAIHLVFTVGEDAQAKIGR